MHQTCEFSIHMRLCRHVSPPSASAAAPQCEPLNQQPRVGAQVQRHGGVTGRYAGGRTASQHAQILLYRARAPVLNEKRTHLCCCTQKQTNEKNAILSFTHIRLNTRTRESNKYCSHAGSVRACAIKTETRVFGGRTARVYINRWTCKHVCECLSH